MKNWNETHCSQASATNFKNTKCLCLHFCEFGVKGQGEGGVKYPTGLTCFWKILQQGCLMSSYTLVHISSPTLSPSKLVFSQNSTVVLSFPFCLLVFCYNLWKTCHVPGGPYGLWLCMAWRWCTQQTHQPPTLHGNKFWMNCLKSIPMLGKIGGQTVFHTWVVVWLLWQNGTFFFAKKEYPKQNVFTAD